MHNIVIFSIVFSTITLFLYYLYSPKLVFRCFYYSDPHCILKSFTRIARFVHFVFPEKVARSPLGATFRSPRGPNDTKSE